MLLNVLNEAADPKASDFEYDPSLYPMFYDYSFGSKPCSLEGDPCRIGVTMCCPYMVCATLNPDAAEESGTCTLKRDVD
ncbi:hypothetical protein V5799_020281 [Amblyomma americanum]|uniref:Uncharacterized protein n=1 Tax=Amblyomma americanum TaxID=6943 RepID=A0AAQ4EUX3_AMBAM